MKVYTDLKDSTSKQRRHIRNITKENDKILGNLPNCIAIADGVISFATSFDTICETLDKVLNQFLENCIKLNKQKCKLFIKEIEYFRFAFSEKGITPSQTKIESIQNMPEPTNISEIRLFLGMPNYLNRFLPNYSVRIYPMLELTMKNIPWLWTQKHQTIFDDLRTYFTQSNFLL